MWIEFLVLASVILQALASVLAVQFVRVSGWRAPWLLVSAALIAMTLQRASVLGRVLAGGAGAPAGAAQEAVALLVSGLLLAGIGWAGPLMRRARRARAAAEHERDNAEQLLDSMQDIVIVADREGRFLRANRQLEDQLGFPASERVGRPVADLHPARARAAFRDHLRRLQEGDTRPLRLPIRTRDGGERMLELTVSAGTWDRRPVFIGIGRDITERLEREQRQRDTGEHLRKMQKLDSLGVLAAGVAHDFNNLLTGILGHAELARSSVGEHAPAADHLAEIEKVSMRAADLCRQLLAYAGRGAYARRPVRLSALVRDLAPFLGMNLPEAARAHLVIEADEEVPPVLGDASQLSQVVLNLVLNAGEALGGSEGPVAVRVGTDRCDAERIRQLDVHENMAPGTYVFLEVEDPGAGMSEAVKARLFEPFFSTRFTGRGLGMAAVLGIVRAMGGGIRVRTAPGRGTAVRLFLPVCGEAQEPGPPGGPRPPAGGGRAVLLVDDDETVRSVGRGMLEGLGRHPLEAADGAEAVRILREHRDAVGCVLLDLTMPGTDTDETFRLLKEAAPRVPVVLCSGYLREEALARFARRDVAGFLPKPFVRADLARVLVEAEAGAEAFTDADRPGGPQRGSPGSADRG